MPQTCRASPRLSSTLVMRNLVVGGRRTSVRLEPVMWEALQEIARRRNLSVHRLATEIDEARTASSLTAAIRVYIVDYYRAAAAGTPPSAPQPQPAWARSLRV